MKKFLLVFSLIFSAFGSFAQEISGDGFYRVINVKESRYIYVTDNTGKVTASDQDFGAIQAIKGLDKAVINPASVLYISKKSGSSYDIEAQGTSVGAIIGRTPNLSYDADRKAYQVYGQEGFVVEYLGLNSYYDDKEVSYLYVVGKKDDYSYWRVEPISTEGDNYFGISPTIEVDGRYYHPFYASFAFSFASEGMKAYYVSATQYDGAKLVEITEDVIPAQTPVIIECSSKNPSDNRLKLLKSGGKAITDNILKGVFFNNKLRPYSKDAVTKNDQTRMRVLGKTDEGKLGFIISDSENISANQFYLPVSTDASKTVNLMDESQYASIEGILSPNFDNSGVYSIVGVKLRDDSCFDNLPGGIYIVNGKKVIKK